MIGRRGLAGLLAGLALVAGPARANCRLGAIAELPITMHGTQPIAPAKIDGQDVSFLVDTGPSSAR